MKTLGICLKISAFLYIAIGAVLEFLLGTPYILIPMFGMGLVVLVVAIYIDRKSRIAAWIGLAVMVLYTPSLFFFLGIPGLIGAYRGRHEWMAWE